MAAARKLETVTGSAALATVRPGTASEHSGVILQTTEGERLILIRLGANPFEDTETAKLAGKTLVVEGYRVGSELRYVSIRNVD